MTAYADSLKPFVGNANVQAFLHVIREGESSHEDSAYFMRWPGKTFDDLTKHPRIFEPGPNGPSSAAGAYQVTYTTYADFAPRLGVSDFSRATQDLIAVAIIHSEGALVDVYDGRIEDAIKKLGGRWASLPSSTAGQRTVKLARLLKVYEKYGGKLLQAAGEPPPAPSPSPAVAPPAPTPKEKPMSSSVIVALGLELLKLLPFAKKPENQQAIEKVGPQLVALAQEAAGPVANEQAAVEAVQKNPQVRDAFVAKAVAKWSDIAPEWEAAERSRATARKFNQEWDGDRLIFGQLRFVELISLLFVLIAAGGGWMVLNGDYPAEMKGAVITLVLISGFTGVKEFWLGSSRDSQRKTELMSEK